MTLYHLSSISLAISWYCTYLVLPVCCLVRQFGFRPKSPNYRIRTNARDQTDFNINWYLSRAEIKYYFLNFWTAGGSIYAATTVVYCLIYVVSDLNPVFYFVKSFWQCSYVAIYLRSNSVRPLFTVEPQLPVDSLLCLVDWQRLIFAFGVHSCFSINIIPSKNTFCFSTEKAKMADSEVYPP